MLIHIVEPGETAYGIAARYGVSPARLLADNGLSASDTLAVGQALLVLIGSTGYYGLCRSMQRLGVPAVFTTQLLFVYRYLYVLIEEAAAMQQARDARSFGRRSYPLKIWGTLVGQLLIRTFDRAEQISRAMLARGFSGRIPEGVFERPAWKMRDTLFLAVWCSAFVLLRLCRPAENLSMLINNL